MGRKRLYASDADRVAAHRARQKLLRNRDSVTLPDAEPGTKGDEAYTDPRVVAAARAALGAIDLDPASCAAAQGVVGATRWYGLDHPDPACRDGLAAPWAGRVWCNPPFSLPRPWVQRLIDAYVAGDISAAVILLKADTCASYSQLIRPVAAASCWPATRLHFWPRRMIRDKDTGKLKPSAPNFVTILWYLGPSPGRFVAAFSPIGDTR